MNPSSSLQPYGNTYAPPLLPAIPQHVPMFVSPGQINTKYFVQICMLEMGGDMVYYTYRIRIGVDEIMFSITQTTRSVGWLVLTKEGARQRHLPYKGGALLLYPRMSS